MTISTKKHPIGKGIRGHLLHLVTHGSSLPPARRRTLYLVVLLSALMIIWLPVLLFISVLPTTYTSRWDLILPGAGTGHAISLESVGQASATAASPYTSHSIDPKVNYKAIAESIPVLATAAAAVGSTVQTFGKARIKLIDQTALMHFRISAATAEQAHQKSQALYNALQAELERLRNDELVQREAAVGRMLEGYNKSLHIAQQNILDYQAKSRIVSQEQFTELAMNLERSRNNIGELKAEYAGLTGSIKALTKSLGIDTKIASALYLLQQDALFQELARKWSEAIANLQQCQSKWGEQHPQVINAKDLHDNLRKQLLKRSQQITPTSKLTPEKLVALASSNAMLYTRLVELNTEQQGMAEQIKDLENSITNQTQYLEDSTTDASTLEDLKRKHQVATAVLTTALAKLDIGKSDRFSSYPLVQLLAKPTLPEKPDKLGRNLALVGGMAGSFFALIGLLILWKRKPYLQKLLKNV